VPVVLRLALVARQAWWAVRQPMGIRLVEPWRSLAVQDKGRKLAVPLPKPAVLVEQQALVARCPIRVVLVEGRPVLAVRQVWLVVRRLTAMLRVEPRR
jgi:hypothetical protein